MPPCTTWPLTSERPFPSKEFRELPREYDCVTVRREDFGEPVLLPVILPIPRNYVWTGLFFEGLTWPRSRLFYSQRLVTRFVPVLYTHVWAGVYRYALGATIICVHTWECMRAVVQVYIYLRCESAASCIICSQRGVNFFGDRISFYAAVNRNVERTSRWGYFSEIAWKHRVVVYNIRCWIAKVSQFHRTPL